METLIGTITGALIVGIFAYFQTKQLIDSKKLENKKELLLVKYECMYKELNDYWKYAQEISLITIQSKDIMELKMNLSNNNFVMHSKFYAPQLSQQTDELTKELGLLILALTNLIVNNDNNKKKLISKVVMISIELQKKVNNIQTELELILNKLIDT